MQFIGHPPPQRGEMPADRGRRDPRPAEFLGDSVQFGRSDIIAVRRCQKSQNHGHTIPLIFRNATTGYFELGALSFFPFYKAKTDVT